ncbi:MAG: CPBP family intramembrane glutamic endopeptidase [Promethearchaeia archaeon]
MASKTDSKSDFHEEIKSIFNRKGIVIILSIIGLTVIYWIIAKWYVNKSGYSKDLVIFYTIFQPIVGDNQWLDFWQYIYQFIITMLLFFLIPYLIVRYYFKEDFRDYGLRWGNKKVGTILTLIFIPILFIVAMFASQDPIMQAEYPLTKLMGENWLVYIYYEAMYFFYFYAYEVLMRGYLQFGLKRKNTTWKGISLILIIQTAITTLFHIGKPMSEITLALVMGPVLGYAALKLDSIWYGMILHFIINVFNDFFILYWLNMLPT